MLQGIFMAPPIMGAAPLSAHMGVGLCTSWIPLGRRPFSTCSPQAGKMKMDRLLMPLRPWAEMGTSMALPSRAAAQVIVPLRTMDAGPCTRLTRMATKPSFITSPVGRTVQFPWGGWCLTEKATSSAPPRRAATRQNAVETTIVHQAAGRCSRSRHNCGGKRRYAPGDFDA